MTQLVPESPDVVYHLSTIVGICILVALYSGGVALRSRIFPSDKDFGPKRQLLVSLPVGLITMALYAKSSFPGLSSSSKDLGFDLVLMAGYSVVFGMLSRETLDRMLAQVGQSPNALLGAAKK